MESSQFVFGCFNFVQHIDFLLVCELKTGGFGEGKWRDQLIFDVEYFLAFGEDGFFEKDYFIGGIGCLGDVFLYSGDV